MLNSGVCVCVLILKVLIHTLLSMFHSRPFIKSRFAPQGVVACVRATSDFYYDIVFRYFYTGYVLSLLNSTEIDWILKCLLLFSSTPAMPYLAVLV